MLWIHSSLSCWIFGLMKVCFLSAQTNSFFFISSQPPPPHFFTLCSLFSFISTVFMLQPGHRVSKPIKSHMKVKYANANVNNFKMFAGRIKTQQFLWRRKKRLINPHSQAYPPPGFFLGDFTQQYSLTQAGWRHSSHWFPLCPFPPPASSQLTSQLMSGCSGRILVRLHLSLSAHVLELLL